MVDWMLLKGWLPLGAVLLFMLGIVQPAWAQGSKPQEPPKIEKTDNVRETLINKLAGDPRVKQPEALRKSYAARDTARLIVSISPPGAMAGYSKLEQRVKAALDRFIGALSPNTQQAVIRRFKTIYAFLVKATPEQLAEILDQEDVTSVEEDARVRLLSPPSVQ